MWFSVVSTLIDSRGAAEWFPFPEIYHKVNFKENVFFRAWLRSWQKEIASVVYNFFAIWLVYSLKPAFLLAITTRYSYQKNSESSHLTVSPNPNFNCKLLQIFKKNYNDFQAKHTYMLFAGREVRIGKNCARGLDYGLRPQAEGRTQDRGHSFSHYGPT